MKKIKKYRIKSIVYANHTEWWVQKRICFLWIPLFWNNTTIAYFKTKESAKDYFEEKCGHKIISYTEYTR